MRYVPGWPPQDLVHCAHELGGGGVLEDVRRGAGAERFLHIVGAVVHGDEHQLGAHPALLELARRIKTVEQRHRDVEQDHVGHQPLGLCQELAAVGYGADQREVIFQKLAHPIE